MVDRPPFGKLGRKPTQVPSRAPEPVRPVIEDARELPGFHGSHIDLHWPKYVATAFAFFAMIYLLMDGKRDAFSIAFVMALAGGLSYLSLNAFRQSVDKLHFARTQLFRSKPFQIGAMLGVGTLVVSQFVNPLELLGLVAADNPFAEGLQAEGAAKVAELILGAAAYMVGGGLAIEFAARLLGLSKDAEDDGVADGKDRR